MMKVFLWTMPRSVSTAFERSIRTLSNAKVFHQVYSSVFFYGPQRRMQNTRFASTAIDPDLTYDYAKSILCKEYDGYELIFSKELTFTVENKFDMFLEEEYREFKHTFLIRDPSEVIPSLYRLYEAKTVPDMMAGYYLDRDEIGFRETYRLYNFVIENGLDENPVVVDAGDLRKNPDETMKRYCEAVGMPYEPHMTTWQPGRVSDWDKCDKYWPGWHAGVINSSGFHKKAPSKTNDLPSEILKLIEASRPYYDELVLKKL